jgi:hypothetical protein
MYLIQKKNNGNVSNAEKYNGKFIGQTQLYSKVYLVLNGKKYWVHKKGACYTNDLGTYSSSVRYSNVVKLPLDVINSIPTGTGSVTSTSTNPDIAAFCKIQPILKKYNGKFVNIKNSNVYLVLNGKKYWVHHPNTCYQGDLGSHSSSGFRNVTQLSEDVINLIPTGTGSVTPASTNPDVASFCKKNGIV